MKFVAYCRVSTERQGESRLGLEAQERDARSFLRAGDKIVASFVEVESGRRCDRPQLAAALKECRLRGATLLLAKLDRLGRNARFLFTLLDGDVPLSFCDMPSADRTWTQIRAVFAEHEGRAISQRTKAALASAKARGVKLGGRITYPLSDVERAKASAIRTAKARERAKLIEPVIAELRIGGAKTLKAIAEGLNERGVTAARGGTWQPTQVARVLTLAS